MNILCESVYQLFMPAVCVCVSDDKDDKDDDDDDDVSGCLPINNNIPCGTEPI